VNFPHFEASEKKYGELTKFGLLIKAENVGKIAFRCSLLMPLAKMSNFHIFIHFSVALISGCIFHFSTSYSPISLFTFRVFHLISSFAFGLAPKCLAVGEKISISDSFACVSVQKLFIFRQHPLRVCVLELFI